jgi:hypothetical protein
MDDCFLEDDGFLSADVIAAEGQGPEDVTRQALWVRVGHVFHGSQPQDEAGVWVHYQERYMGSPLAGPVLLTPAVWRQLAQAIEDRLSEWEERHGKAEALPMLQALPKALLRESEGRAYGPLLYMLADEAQETLQVAEGKMSDSRMNDITQLSPGKIAVAGDWHANTLWAVSAIRQACVRLPNENPRVIVQAGDLGVWKWAAPFLADVTAVLAQHDALLLFVDGNHEDHPWLAELAGADGWITPRIRWLSRGTRWTWHDRTWLAVGGAVSVDKGMRDEGVDWFPGEEITDGQEVAIIAGGPADVLVSHDCPAEVRLPLGVPPLEWLSMIPKAEEHRERMQRICTTVRPRWIFHGHYHLTGEARCRKYSWGSCTVLSLDMDTRQGNWGILDTETMEWKW